jgi:hypothetical protein
MEDTQPRGDPLLEDIKGLLVHLSAVVSNNTLVLQRPQELDFSSDIFHRSSFHLKRFDSRECSSHSIDPTPQCLHVDGGYFALLGR